MDCKGLPCFKRLLFEVFIVGWKLPQAHRLHGIVQVGGQLVYSDGPCQIQRADKDTLWVDWSAFIGDCDADGYSVIVHEMVAEQGFSRPSDDFLERGPVPFQPVFDVALLAFPEDHYPRQLPGLVDMLCHSSALPFLELYVYLYYLLLVVADYPFEVLLLKLSVRIPFLGLFD